jgi:hypothetical protein
LASVLGFWHDTYGFPLCRPDLWEAAAREYFANERLSLSNDRLAMAAKANLENTRSQFLQPFLVFGIV